MPSTIFVTGATGQTGGNVCEQLIQRGDQVRALVRNPDEASALSDIGVEVIKGDIRDGDDVLRAAAGAEAAIHCAALLGGASQDLEDFKAVNMVGTTNVLDAAKAHGMRRVVALSTATFLDLSTGVDFEEAPVLDNPPKDPYTVTKLAAFSEAHRRAAAGDDVLTCHPGAIFGPAPVVERALHRTSFNRVLLAGMRGKIKRYLAFPVTWVAGKDVATGSIAALDRGRNQSCLRDRRNRPSCRGSRLPHGSRGIDRRIRAHLDGHRESSGQERAQAENRRQPDHPAPRLCAHVLRRRAAAADLVAAWTRPARSGGRLNSGLKRRGCRRVDRRTARIRFSSWRSRRSDTRGGSPARAEDGRTQVVVI